MGVVSKNSSENQIVHQILSARGGWCHGKVAKNQIVYMMSGTNRMPPPEHTHTHTHTHALSLTSNDVIAIVIICFLFQPSLDLGLCFSNEFVLPQRGTPGQIIQNFVFWLLLSNERFHRCSEVFVFEIIRI